MKYKFYLKSESAWAAMYDSISKAKKSIFIEMYIFLANTKRYDFIGELSKKSKQGVKVVMVIDWYGSYNLKKESVQKLKKAGIEVLFYSSFFKRNHRKLVVVDEKIAFLGGVNINEDFKDWTDLHIKMSGYIVGSILKSFARTYKFCNGKDIEILKYHKKKRLQKMKHWFIEHSPAWGKIKMKSIYKELIVKSEKEIIIVTPYFSPKRKVLAFLHQAVLRKVDVNIIIPSKTDLRFMTRINYFNIYKIAPLGIKFYITKEMNHAKAILVDNNEGIVGSQNLDAWSFEYSFEYGVHFKNKNMIKDLSKILNTWKENADPFDRKKYSPKWYDYILSPITTLVRNFI